MDYCLEYRRDLKNIAEAAELNITYNSEDKTLFDWLPLQEQRINIYIPHAAMFISKNELQKFIEYEQKSEKPVNYCFVLESYLSDSCKVLYEEIKEKSSAGIFFKTRVKDWDTLTGMAELQITDMYVTEELCFDLMRVKDYLKSRGIRVRTFANVCQTSWPMTESINTFFIRPEDVSFYDRFIDVLEFYYKEIKHQDVLLSVYKNQKIWYGPLYQIIFDFKDKEVYNNCIMPEFAPRRLDCRKTCMKGGPCRHCTTIVRISKILKENNMAFREKKTKVEPNNID